MQESTEVPRHVIAADQKAERASGEALEVLAKLRWHWTTDPSNAKRVSIRAYAKAVGRHRRVIAGQAQGYAAWIDQGGAGTGATPIDGAGVGFRSLDECIERSKVGVEKEAAIDAVAKATGTSFGTSRKDHKTVETVRAIAENRAERRGTTPAEEIDDAAEWVAKSRKSAAKRREVSKEAKSLRYIELEGHISYAMNRLRSALKVAEENDFDDDEKELISDSLGQLRALLNLIDAHATGTIAVDWDAELAKMEGKA